jgi:hypothetical protein
MSAAVNQIGGRLLGQGVYGCTFDPVPRCADGRTFKSIGDLPAVGKVTSEDSNEELAIGVRIMSLPHATDYFALPTISCRPALPITDPDVKHCKVVTKSQSDTRFSMLVMPAAGQQLKTYSYNLPKLAGNFKKILIHLLEGATIYQDAGYVHSDIHPGNILIGNDDTARFIDFGLAFDITKVKTWKDTNLGVRFRPQYLWQAPEMHAMRAYFTGVPLDDAVWQLYDLHKEYQQLERAFPMRPTAYTALLNLMKSVEHKDSSFVRKYGKKIDSWRIGLCMWERWYSLKHWLPFIHTQVYKERELIEKVLSGLTDFDPRSRMSIREALAVISPNSEFVREP